MAHTRTKKRIQRHRRVRAKIQGTQTRPRLSVFRSNRHISVQLIDDMAGKTLAAISDREFSEGKKKIGGKSIPRGAQVGEAIAKEAVKKGFTEVVFDRGGYRYHGIVRAVAEGARKGGLTF